MVRKSGQDIELYCQFIFSHNRNRYNYPVMLKARENIGYFTQRRIIDDKKNY